MFYLIGYLVGILIFLFAGSFLHKKNPNIDEDLLILGSLFWPFFLCLLPLVFVAIGISFILSSIFDYFRSFWGRRDN